MYIHPKEQFISFYWLMIKSRETHNPYFWRTKGFWENIFSIDIFAVVDPEAKKTMSIGAVKMD